MFHWAMTTLGYDFPSLQDQGPHLTEADAERSRCKVSSAGLPPHHHLHTNKSEEDN